MRNEVEDEGFVFFYRWEGNGFVTALMMVGMLTRGVDGAVGFEGGI